MKSPSIDLLHSKIYKHILLTESYSEVSGIAAIIRMCRLKPFEYIYEKRNNILILYKLWFDEFGNSLSINNKNITIKYNDLKIPNQICTDLYYGLTIDKIVKISKLAIIFYGKDEDLNQDCFLIGLVGIDNYIRTYLYMYKQWQQVSPLLIGIKFLQKVVNNLDIKYYQEFSIKENSPIPCIETRAWLTYLPISNSLSAHFNKEHDIIDSLFNTKGIE